MKVAVDPRRCQQVGYCVRIAPKVFELAPTGDGPTRTLVDSVDGELRELAMEAEATCPTGAISIDEKGDFDGNS